MLFNSQCTEFKLQLQNVKKMQLKVIASKR